MTDFPEPRIRKPAFATPALALLGAALAAIFHRWRTWGRTPDFNDHLPGLIALGLVGGSLYLAAVYLVSRYPYRWPALLVVVAGAVAFRALLLPLPPELSDDVNRYQWEGRIERARLNPYQAYPARLDLQRFEDAEHPVRTGRFTPTVYPPLSEAVFALAETPAGYKRLFVGFDLAAFAAVLLLLAAMEQPLARSLIYAWNPAVIASFALSGHHDSLAVLALLAAHLLRLRRKPALAAASLALAVLAKLFPLVLLPVFIKKINRKQAVCLGVFISVLIAGFLPYAPAGSDLLHGLAHYAAAWEANDSLFRLLLLAGNSKAQAEFLAGVLVALLVAVALRQRMEPAAASLFLIAALLLVSPNAFPWYFTWFIPFLCFYPSPPLLLLSVTSFLAYAPVIPYAAGLPYQSAPLFPILEYAPVYAWLLYDGAKAGLARSSGRSRESASSLLPDDGASRDHRRQSESRDRQPPLGR